MARTVRDTNLETRTARARLSVKHKPYWRKIDQGCHVGYYKGRRAGSWIARRFIGKGKYEEVKLGPADDVLDADGVAILSFAHAQAKAREWFTAQARKAAGVAESNGPYTVADAIGDYLADYQQRRGKAVEDARTRAEALILPSLGSIEVARLTSRHIKAWHTGVADAPARIRTRRGDPQQYKALADDPESIRRRRATANRTLTVLKAALNHAWREGEAASDDAWRRVKPFPEAEAARTRYLNHGEITRLMNACEPDFRRLVKAALLTGCRYGELTAMKCCDFNADSRMVSVQASKSGKSRHVPLNDEGAAFFGRVCAGRAGEELMFLKADGKPWGQSHQRRRLDTAAKIAGVENVSFHILRHSYGSALAMKGVPMAVIAAALGHADTRMTEKHYAALAPSYIADTIRANLPPLGIVESDNITAPKR